MKNFHTLPLVALAWLLAHLLPALGLVFVWAAAHSPYVQGFTLLAAALYRVLKLLLVLPRLWALLKRGYLRA